MSQHEDIGAATDLAKCLGTATASAIDLILACLSIVTAHFAGAAKAVVVLELCAPVCRVHLLRVDLVEVGYAELLSRAHILPTVVTFGQA